MTDEDIRQDILTKLTVPLWPTAGRALGVCRNAAYRLAKEGYIPTLELGRNRSVPTAQLRQMLGIRSVDEAA